MTAGKATSEQVHHVAMHDRCVVTHRLRLALAVRLEQVPAAGLVLLISRLVEITEGVHVDHPQVVEEALTDVVATKDVQLVLMDEGRVVATPLWYLGVKSDLKPVEVRGAELVFVGGGVELLQGLEKDRVKSEMIHTTINCLHGYLPWSQRADLNFPSCLFVLFTILMN